MDTNVGRVLARAVANRTLTLAEARVRRQRTPAANGRRLVQSGHARPRRAVLHVDAATATSCPVARVCTWHLEGGPDPAPRSAGVSRPQPTFQGSDRQARGRVLAALRERPRSMRQLLARHGRRRRESWRGAHRRTGCRRSRRTTRTLVRLQRRRVSGRFARGSMPSVVSTS